MFQNKGNETFKEPPNVFGIKDDIVIVSDDADVKDNDRTMR